MRIAVLVCVRWLGVHGISRRDATERIGLAERTVGAWQRGWRANRLEMAPRGRPLERTDRATRDGVLAILQLAGPGIGLPTLQALFPRVARGELLDLVRRYRRVHLKRASLLVYALRWHGPGRIWAMDFTRPPAPIDGEYGRILVVRDLPSGRQLLALPAEGETAAVVLGALRALFVEYGTPLVIKSDNGPSFVAQEVKDYLADQGVSHLLSPPETPEYNGACEAGIGSLKTRAHHEAAKNDRPGEWTCDDVEAARLQANELARPRGHEGPTPDEAWRSRTTVDFREWLHFADKVDELRGDVATERRTSLDQALRHHEETTIDRIAISRALVALGYLSIRRRRIPPPISLRALARIS